MIGDRSIHRTVLRLAAGLALPVLGGWCCPVPAEAEEGGPEGSAGDAKMSLADREFFEKSVRPVLVDRCQECHSSDSPESGLSVERLEGLLQGGERGPAIVPGKPESSLLVRALSHGDVELQMPPKAKLPAAEIAALTEWVRRGAFWPGEQVSKQTEPKADSPSAAGGFTAEQLEFWAFQSPTMPALPPVENRNWLRSPIDAFILHRLETAGMSPAPPADRRTLVRRVYFDLLGAPPTPDEIADFIADESPDAYARLVDRCLASPHYGERWGRYWLDVARYADSNGLDENLAYGNAFRYRDYVIAAFNADKPYDAFVHEQLAGDLLHALPQEATADAGLANERIVATGFLALGGKMLAEDDPVKMQMDIIDEQVDTLGKAFLGMTFGCARCHDHKFDPVTQDDYYGLAGVFKSTRTMENFSVVARWQESPLGSPAEIAQLDLQRKKVDEQKRAISEFEARQNEQVLVEARAQIGRYLLAARRAELQSKLISAAIPRGADISESGAPPAGVHLREAEQFQRGNVAVHTGDYGEGIGVIVNAGPVPNFAEYDIACDAPGVFQFEIRHAAAEPRGIQVVIDGAVAFPDAISGVTGTWYPDSQTWTVVGFVELSAGPHTLRLQRDGPVSHIDKLLLTPVDDQAAAALASGALEQDGRRLHTVFIEQWRKLLASELPDNSPLLPARRAFQDLPPEEWFTNVPDDVRDLFGTEPPRTATELASAYVGLLARSGSAGEGSAALKKLREIVVEPSGPFALPTPADALYSADSQAELQRQREFLSQLEAELPKLPETMAVSDTAPENLRIHLRGSHQNLGSEVPRHVPAIFGTSTDAPRIGDDQGSGRLELAHWLTRPDHPLTARVMVNRVWQWHFGKGLVRSPDNFGLLGEFPTHPALLDWLAVEFTRSGWSLKDLHRLILMSAAYQMSTAFRADYDAVDPENKLLWRMNRRRLDAEAIRDAILAVTSTLDDQMQGSLLTIANRAYVTSTASVNPDLYRTNRRSVYLPVIRSALYDMFQAFDFADPSTMSGVRDTTTVASQALFMMNSELVAQKSAALADRVLAESVANEEERVRLLFETVLGREPAAEETAAALTFVADYNRAADPASGALTDRPGWRALCRAVISSNEFLYVE